MAIVSLSRGAKTSPGKIKHVRLPGTGRPVQWKQSEGGLHAEMPKGYEPGTVYALSFRVFPVQKELPRSMRAAAIGKKSEL